MKPLLWMGSSLADLCSFPRDVRKEAGYSIHLAQLGDKALNAVPMVGFGSAKVLEVVINSDGDTFRAVYTVKFAKAVYVLHAFQKKSKKGISTPKPDIDLIHRRLMNAENHYQRNYDKRRQGESRDGKKA